MHHWIVLYVRQHWRNIILTSVFYCILGYNYEFDESMDKQPNKCEKLTEIGLTLEPLSANKIVFNQFY